jgi:hypothetical protein
MEVDIRMHRRILQVLSNLDKEDFNLFRRPSQGSSEGTDGDCVQTIIDDTPVIESNHLEVGVLGPRSDWHLLDLVADIDEPSVVQSIGVLLGSVHLDA